MVLASSVSAGSIPISTQSTQLILLHTVEHLEAPLTLTLDCIRTVHHTRFNIIRMPPLATFSGDLHLIHLPRRLHHHHNSSSRAAVVVDRADLVERQPYPLVHQDLNSINKEGQLEMHPLAAAVADPEW